MTLADVQGHAAGRGHGRPWLALVAMLLFALVASRANAEEYPVLFVHGICSDGGTWDKMRDNLPRARFGEEFARLYQASNGSVFVRGSAPPNSRSFAIDFYDAGARTFDERTVADIAIIDKAGQLKAVINHVKSATGASKVIIVSHSMGGLVTRAYVQGYALNSSGRIAPYENDIARLITIDTPHQGSPLSYIPLDFTDHSSCIRAATINKAELEPGSTFLNMINDQPWPHDTRLDAIVSFYLGGADHDDVVSRNSQDVRTISTYWATHPSVDAHLQSFIVPRPAPKVTLHSTVLGSATTASRVATLIEDTDRISAASAPIPSPMSPGTANLSGIWSGQWSSSDGRGQITLTLTQTGSMLSGPMEMPGTTITGTFQGQLTSTAATSSPVQWTINYSSRAGCRGSFGGVGTIGSTSFQGSYSGSDCTHAFTGGNLSLLRSVSSNPVTVTPASTQRYVVSASSLYLSDFTAGGNDALVGAIRTASRSSISAPDIAITPDGRAFAASFTNLYSLDLSTATITPIGSGGLASVNSLTSDSAGLLWGASSTDGSVYQINATTGAATLVGRFGPGWLSSGDLAFDQSGTLWATIHRSGDGADTLATVDTRTGLATPRIQNLPRNLYGLTFIQGSLYGLSASTNSLYRVNPETGEVTFVRSLSFSPAGSSRIPR